MRRLIAATEDSAIQLFMVSFSASRLNGFRFPFFFFSFSFLDFLEELGPKKELGEELLPGWPVVETVDEFLV